MLVGMERAFPLQWCHNDHDGVLNHRPHDCLINRLKHQSSAPLAFVPGIHRLPMNSPHKRSVTRKMFPFDDVIMTRPFSQQRISIEHYQHVPKVFYAKLSQSNITSGQQNIFTIINRQGQFDGNHLLVNIADLTSGSTMTLPLIHTGPP